ncbi:MAG: Fic family protein [Mariprofundaceae bacterium]|nr:Fic family protein [Mariprofundaceae bacterium]
MVWNWQQKAWPNFCYEAQKLTALENRFLLEGGKLVGALPHLSDNNQFELLIAFIEEEALKSSKIEGEILDLHSLRVSLQKNFGLETDGRHIPAREKGIACMMVDTYQSFEQTLSHEMIWDWHKNLMLGNRRIDDVGCYRTHADAMIIGSHNFNDTSIYFEAPPSSMVAKEMDAFVDWFNGSAPDGHSPLPALTRAGLAHLYFVSVHPFEDGNGRIGRALSEKILSQHLGTASLIPISHVIEKYKKDYYAQLETNNRDLSIDAWLDYFAHTILESLDYAQQLTTFVVNKSRLYARIKGVLNDRQHKVLDCMLKKGVEGWRGGLTSEKYCKIGKTTLPTAKRDIQKLLQLGVLTKTGQGKATRYWLPF